MPPNLIVLILLLSVALAAVVGTLIFVRAVDRRLERERTSETAARGTRQGDVPAGEREA